MAKRSSENLLKLFESNEMVEFKDIRKALDHASRATCFRYLRQVPYHRSYNHNGRYYTRKDPTRYDRFGLFSYGAVFFSRDNTLGETIQRLVRESEAGWTQREFQDVLRVRVQVVLLNTFQQGKIDREKVHGFYVYLHPDPAVRGAQLNRRREYESFAAPTTDGELAIADAVIIQVLLTLLHHPGAKAADVVRYLRGHSPPIAMAEVRMVFTRYGLESIGKKGGASNC
ncbi:MAG: hypothetical protein GY701_05070 [Sulfitobacter sp.]|nr:hypothetical protein [Sulfitobacter sp.]